MFSVNGARELLTAAGVFFPVFDDDDDPQTLNMNDVWGWAVSYGEKVEDEELPEVALLFYRYGWCGILYWVSEKNGGMKTEFLDNNRFIEFVKNEETLRKAVVDSNTRAYQKLTYTLGE